MMAEITFNEKLLRGVQGGMFHVFSKRVPLAAGGIKKNNCLNQDLQD
jgi:hypothetical protein